MVLYFQVNKSTSTDRLRPQKVTSCDGDDGSDRVADACIGFIALLIVLIITTPWEEVYDLGGK